MDDNYNTTGYNFTETRFKFGNNNHTLKLGLDWYADKKNIFGVIVSGFTFKGHPTPVSVSNLVDENMQLESRLVSTTDNKIKFQNGTLNLCLLYTSDAADERSSVDLG